MNLAGFFCVKSIFLYTFAPDTIHKTRTKNDQTPANSHMSYCSRHADGL